LDRRTELPAVCIGVDELVLSGAARRPADHEELSSELPDERQDAAHG
jgi:hypothetical protein